QELLPQNYRAIPKIHVGTRVEIDVATFEHGEVKAAEGNGVTTAVWAPPNAKLAAIVDFTDRDTFEVQIEDTDQRRLVAAIELVSPANKDRPDHRRDFVVKCASYLQQSVSLVVVDVVTERHNNLHVELMQFLEMPLEIHQAADRPVYAVAYRIQE